MLKHALRVRRVENLELPFGVQLLQEFSPAEWPPHGGALVANNAGAGWLCWVYSGADSCGSPTPSRDYSHDSFLLLGDVPLLHWQDENDCPTCPQLLQTGDTPAAEAAKFAAAINELRNDQTVAECLPALSAVIRLLPVGVYGVSYQDLIPTDGEGKFFWRVFGELRLCRPLSQHTIFDAVKGGFNLTDSYDRPIFLAATQSTQKFSMNSLERAKQTFREHPGLALDITGRIAALLDGHHRATCAAMHGELFRCLTLAEVAESSPTRTEKGYLYGGGRQFFWENLNSSTKSWFSKHGNQHSCRKKVSDKESRSHRDALQRVTWPALPPAVMKLINPEVYLTDEQCSLLASFGMQHQPIDQEIIEQILTGNYEHEAARHLLRQLLQALFTSHDSRAEATAIRVAQDAGWASQWETAYTLLATLRTEAVENQFVDYLVNDDGARPEVKAIVDQYFATDNSIPTTDD